MSELHFISYHEQMFAVEADNQEEAIQTVSRIENITEDRLYHGGTESGVKEHLEDNQLVYL